MHYEIIPHGSPDYAATCALRHDVLRVPIGMVLRPEDVDGEERQLHFVGRDAAGAIVACVLFKPLGPTHIKLRQMAVAPHMHGKGVGRQIIAHAEAEVAARGYRTIETNARHTAQAFYEKLGYTPASALFEEVGLHTLKMIKEL
jgi:GNAT superfamily N-acetyltransferase